MTPPSSVLVVAPVRRPLRVRVLRALGGVALAVLALGAAGYVHLRHPLPTGVTGAPADALAHDLVSAVDGDAWDNTQAVRWTFFNGTSHLWDRARMFDAIRHGDDRVLLDLTTHDGRAWHGSTELTGPARRAALDHALAVFNNDSFWLNPVVKAFDDGVTRRAVALPDGGHGLLVSYASGGTTPGDSYLWIPGADHRPRAWRMWVQVLPVPGLEATWQGWTRLATGAWVATEHVMAGITVRIRDVSGARTLGELSPGPDPFAELMAR